MRVGLSALLFQLSQPMALGRDAKRLDSSGITTGSTERPMSVKGPDLLSCDNMLEISNAPGTGNDSEEEAPTAYKDFKVGDVFALDSFLTKFIHYRTAYGTPAVSSNFVAIFTTRLRMNFRMVDIQL